MNYEFSNGIIIDIEIIRKNNKNIYFRIKEDLKLYISAPMYISQKEIKRMIAENEKEIFSMYEKMEAKVKEDEQFWHLGKKYYIVIDENIEGVQFNDREVIVRNREELEKFQKTEMDRIFQEEIELSKKCFASLPEFTYKTRKMTSRWGVCNTKKKIITLNTELIKKDIDLIDYVIIHELCHFYEQNHSKDFWALVEAALPNYKEARKRLRN